MKKILSVLLVSVMLLGLLAGCDGSDNAAVYPTTPITPTNPTNPTNPADPTDPTYAAPIPVTLDEEALKGSWTLNAHADTAAMNAMIEAFGEFETDATIKCTYIFGDDGEATIRYHEDDMVAFYDALYEDLGAFLADGAIYKVYEAQGFTKETLDAAMEESDMTLEELTEAVIVAAKAQTLEAFEKQYDTDGYMEVSCSYTLEDGVLTLTDGETFEYVVNCTVIDSNKSILMTDVDEETPLNNVAMVKAD